MYTETQIIPHYSYIHVHVCVHVHVYMYMCMPRYPYYNNCVVNHKISRGYFVYPRAVWYGAALVYGFWWEEVYRYYWSKGQPQATRERPLPPCLMERRKERWRGGGEGGREGKGKGKVATSCPPQCTNKCIRTVLCCTCVRSSAWSCICNVRVHDIQYVGSVAVCNWDNGKCKCGNKKVPFYCW